jgi:predicted nuclease with TOPRIM domain
MTSLPQAEDLKKVRELLGAKLQAALRDEVTLVERTQHLEAERAALEEQVAALRDGQGEAVQRLSAQLAAGEAERSALHKSAAEQRLALEEVLAQHIVLKPN